VEAAWSTAVGAADWIGARLAPFDAHQVTSVVPSGFEAYTRVLHPAETPGPGDRLVRWAEVAAWSGQPLRADSQFHSIALPPGHPAAAAPWSSQGPEPGRLYRPDAEVLAGLLPAWTTVPEQCFFCLWDGYDWAGVRLTTGGQPPVRLPDPVPAPIRQGPRVRLPHRDYLLATAPVEAVTAVAALTNSSQTPNLWWPADRAWCVATEIDLPWTYVAGPAALIETIRADPRLEALPAAPADPVNRFEPWVTAWVDEAVDSLLATGQAVITTSGGTLRARLARHWLRITTEADNGISGSSSARLNGRRGAGLREELGLHLTLQVIGLVGG
jgi:hypothetical protein